MFAQPFAALLLGITLVTWSILLVRRRPGQPLLAYEPRRPVPWGLVDVLFAIGLLVVGSSVALAVMGDRYCGSSRSRLADAGAGLAGPERFTPRRPSPWPSLWCRRSPSCGDTRATGRELGWVVGKIGSRRAAGRCGVSGCWRRPSMRCS